MSEYGKMAPEDALDELRKLELDYVDLDNDFNKLYAEYMELKAKQPSPENQQLRLANARVRTCEAYLEAYEEFYGELPKGLHTAVLLMAAVPHMSDETRKKRARELAHDAKQIDKFSEKVKGWFKR